MIRKEHIEWCERVKGTKALDKCEAAEPLRFQIKAQHFVDQDDEFWMALDSKPLRFHIKARHIPHYQAS
jgi:hypothetical protein